jgi:hypothetical protein
MVSHDRLIETTILVDLLRGKEEAMTWVNRGDVPHGSGMV